MYLRLWYCISLSLIGMLQILSQHSLTSRKALLSTLMINVKSLHHKYNSSDCTNTAHSSQRMSEVKKIGEEVVYRGYRNVVRKQILLPSSENIINYDTIDAKSTSVTVFVWDRNTSTCTLIREYHPGIEEFMFGTVAGMYEPSKHISPIQAAQFELEEEAQLTSVAWFSLLDDSSRTVSFDKYSNNRFYPFLALDCKKVANPKLMDDEEFITTQSGTTYQELMKMIRIGKINVLSSYTILMGLNKLKELEIPLE
eukprot:gene16013-21732_t